ncbi:hypothetical protein ES288_D06G124200v1, partial [Gossypium darwinii]
GHTVIGCSRTQEKLNSLQSELWSPDRHLLLNVDLKFVPDIIVNNAGTINKNNRIWEVPVEECDTVIDTNVKGIANVLRHFIPLMLPKSQGIIHYYIVYLDMIVLFVVNSKRMQILTFGYLFFESTLLIHIVAPYCASKWAVEGLSRAVAKEMPDEFAVVALSPGVINTEMLQSCFGNSASGYQTPDACHIERRMLTYVPLRFKFINNP